MAHVYFTRDEIILGLDVWYCSGEGRLNNHCPPIEQYSELLNQLPIHPLSAHREKYAFRNPRGVFEQLHRFDKSLNEGTKHKDVNSLFYEVWNMYGNRLDELHEIAEAIRRNAPYYEEFPFGNDIETSGFPEGALLGHLHRAIEIRDGGSFKRDTRCMICSIETESIYNGNLDLMENHLMTPLVKLDAKRRYKEEDFITVCPNCHAALHRYRPWLTFETSGLLLR